jgi:hypothetical protein
MRLCPGQGEGRFAHGSRAGQEVEGGGHGGRLFERQRVHEIEIPDFPPRKCYFAGIAGAGGVCFK